jgi:formiminoglutamate deiminase
MATAHSHAFQRALRGRTQRRHTGADTFWSWRALMYRLAERLGPEDLFHIARFAYAELALSGVTAVGEFHYLHHDKNGVPYASRTELAEAVIRAAEEVGIRLCLIRTAYMRGGPDAPLAPAQRRFADPSVDRVLRDVEQLRADHNAAATISVGVAAHSVRAASIEAIRTLAAYAAEQDLPFHMHVCEQRRELEDCLAEHGVTPVALLAEHGVLSPRFVGVHATHLAGTEIAALGQAGAYVCLCRTTERDLGDGLPPVSDLMRAGARLCVGVDSHAGENPFEEIRAVEMDERSRLETRHTVAEAPVLLDAATRAGYAAIGMADRWQEDRVWLDRDDPSLAGIPPGLASDAILFGATPRAVRRVEVAGRVIVEDGRHAAWEVILEGYLKTMRGLDTGR